MSIQPERVLRELGDLWVSLGKQAGDPDSGGVLRACAMTLVVLLDAGEDPQAVGETLALLMKEHPSRAIVVRVSAGAASLEARVYAQCWMPFGSRQQICCEQVEIVTPESELAEIPAAILPLAVADLPVILWNRIPGRLAGRAAGEFSRIATKTIVDSAAYADSGAALGAIRDALDFVNFNDFTNQIDFAQFGKAFNTYVDKTVTAPLPRGALVGKAAKVLGAFPLATPGEVPLVTPLTLEVSP